MKTIHTISILAVFLAATANISAQNYPDEYLGLPGDNLNLYAVMNMFQESETLEGFERSLNDEESMINNLDLNGDNLIDYIAVSDYVDGNVHSIVLRAALNRNEQQDVAVFVVEKLRDGAVQIQLIGDEALYGPNYIVEPIYAETANPGYTGKSYNRNVNVITTSYYDIAAWPMIRYMYHPRYVVWRSSWHWGYYPSYWNPWRAHYWHYYYGYHNQWHNHYYSHYRHWNHYRGRSYQTYYHSKVRVYSPNVTVNINNGRYRNTYSRPDQTRAGEAYYANSARARSQSNRTGVESNRQSVKRTSTPASRTRTEVPTSRRSSSTVRTTSTPGNNSTRSVATRSSSSRSTPTVQRSSSKSSSTVQRSQPSKSTTVQRSSQPVQNRSTVQRSSSSKSSGSVSRSSSSKSTPSVQRSSSRSSSSKSSTVQRSQPSKSKSSVKQSQPSRSSSSAKRSSTSSSSRKSSSSQRSSSTTRR